MRIRRRCYDKPHRCSGWAGGGFWFPKRGAFGSCPNGSMPYPDSLRATWAFAVCNKGCGTIALPWATRWLDYSWYRHVVIRNLIWKIKDWKYWRDYGRGIR